MGARGPGQVADFVDDIGKRSGDGKVRDGEITAGKAGNVGIHGKLQLVQCGGFTILLKLFNLRVIFRLVRRGRFGRDIRAVESPPDLSAAEVHGAGRR